MLTVEYERTAQENGQTSLSMILSYVTRDDTAGVMITCVFAEHGFAVHMNKKGLTIHVHVIVAVLCVLSVCLCTLFAGRKQDSVVSEIPDHGPHGARTALE